MNKILVLIGWFLFNLKKVYNNLVCRYIKTKFARIGKNVDIGSGGIFTYKNIEIGDEAIISSNVCIRSSYGKIIIGNHSMIGPNTHIHGGNHKFNEIGRLMRYPTPKQMGDDGVITIEDDCWIGANVIILSNVTIGRGSIIGAGSIVTKDVPPYSIYTGGPSVKIRNRFTPEELEEHKKILGL